MFAEISGPAALAFVLGLRHAVDADHLAAIDGLTRWNSGAQRPFAPYCGALFASGHAAVILLAAIGLAALSSLSHPPAWLGSAGGLISAVTLLVLSLINLRVAFDTTRKGEVRPVGMRSRAFAALLRAPRAWQVVLLGALFAVSLDSLALAAVFATSGSSAGGVIVAAALALAFALGMLTVGTANGLWIVRLLKHSDDASLRASRTLTLTIALVGLLIGVGVLLTFAFEAFESWLADHELIVSGFVVGAVLAGYISALVLTNRAHRPHTRAIAETRNA